MFKPFPFSPQPWSLPEWWDLRVVVSTLKEKKEFQQHKARSNESASFDTSAENTTIASSCTCPSVLQDGPSDERLFSWDPWAFLAQNEQLAILKRARKDSQQSLQLVQELPAEGMSAQAGNLDLLVREVVICGGREASASCSKRRKRAKTTHHRSPHLPAQCSSSRR